MKSNTTNHIYTEEEDNWLIQNFSKYQIYQEIAEAFNNTFNTQISKGSISAHCRKIGIYKYKQDMQKAFHEALSLPDEPSVTAISQPAPLSKNKMLNYTFDIPKDDADVLRFIKNQSYLSASLRIIIKDYISRNGYQDSLEMLINSTCNCSPIPTESVKKTYDDEVESFNKNLSELQQYKTSLSDKTLKSVINKTLSSKKTTLDTVSNNNLLSVAKVYNKTASNDTEKVIKWIVECIRDSQWLSEGASFSKNELKAFVHIYQKINNGGYKKASIGYAGQSIREKMKRCSRESILELGNICNKRNKYDTHLEAALDSWLTNKYEAA